MIQLPENLPRLHADRRRTKQIFLNLLNNAVKFTPPGGKVSIIGTREPERGLVVEVHDTGVGIAKENLEKVVQPFVQLRSADGAVREGTGLGLSLVRVMMERHGGAFELDSNPGENTTARVIFPPQRLLPAQEPGETASALPSLAPVETRRTQTVLIVDDDENLLHLLGAHSGSGRLPRDHRHTWRRCAEMHPRATGRSGGHGYVDAGNGWKRTVARLAH